MERFTLAVDRLIEGEPGEQGADVTVADPAAHPLAKLAAALGDLERWHRTAGRAEAAFEARRERLVLLADNFDAEQDRPKIRADLEKALDEARRRAPMVVARHAHPRRVGARSGRAAGAGEAREIALRGAAEAPRQRRRQALPPPRRRGRAARLLAGGDAERRARQALHPGHSQEPGEALVPRLRLRPRRPPEERARLQPVAGVAGGRDAGADEEAAGELERRPAGDARLPRPSHLRHAADDAPGPYVIVASRKPEFHATDNRRSSVNLIVGDLVLLAQRRDDGIAVRVVSGSSGRPVAGAAIELWNSTGTAATSASRRSPPMPPARRRCAGATTARTS